MNKKSDKKICWNCDGDVSLTLLQCPYCGVNVSGSDEKNSAFSHFVSPFQGSESEAIPKPPYGNLFSKDFSVSEEEWNKALEEEKTEAEPIEENASPTTKKEIVAFLLLLPGIVFCLFSLTLFFFSEDGVLTLRWNQNLAYFYLVGAIPLLFLGWRAFK